MGTRHRSRTGPFLGIEAFGILNPVVDDLRFGVFDLVVNRFIACSLLPSHLRRAMYRMLGFRVGNATLAPHLIFKTNQVTFGDNVFINEGCRFDNLERVTIGDNVAIGPETLFVTSSHEAGRRSARAGDIVLTSVEVCSGCWIGARVIILPGVTVGHGCVVAAGAVVGADCLPDGLYGGVPAKRLRDLP